LNKLSREQTVVDLDAEALVQKLSVELEIVVRPVLGGGVDRRPLAIARAVE
jgi:hypothetical protein